MCCVIILLCLALIFVDFRRYSIPYHIASLSSLSLIYRVNHTFIHAFLCFHHSLTSFCVYLQRRRDRNNKLQMAQRIPKDPLSEPIVICRTTKLYQLEAVPHRSFGITPAEVFGVPNAPKSGHPTAVTFIPLHRESSDTGSGPERRRIHKTSYECGCVETQTLCGESYNDSRNTTTLVPAVCLKPVPSLPPVPVPTPIAATSGGGASDIVIGGKSVSAGGAVGYPFPAHFTSSSCKRIIKEYQSWYRDHMLGESSHSASGGGGGGLARRPPCEMYIAPNPLNFAQWRVWIGGSLGSVFEGCLLQFHIEFLPAYPLSPFMLSLTCPEDVDLSIYDRWSTSRRNQRRMPWRNDTGFIFCCWNKSDTNGWSPAYTVPRIVSLAASATIAGKGDDPHLWYDHHLVSAGISPPIHWFVCD